jgi:hypothetical protein
LGEADAFESVVSSIGCCVSMILSKLPRLVT